MKNTIDSRIFSLENEISIQHYHISGQILNEQHSLIYGIGTADITIFHNTLAKIDINCKTSPIVNDNGTIDTDSLFTYGINRDIFTDSYGVPFITPLKGGSCIILNASEGTLDNEGMGWGGSWQAIDQFWVPARVYTDDGIIGAWPASSMKNKRLIGTCYGILS